MSDVWAWGVEDDCGFRDGRPGNRHVYTNKSEAERHAKAANLPLIPLVAQDTAALGTPRDGVTDRRDGHLMRELAETKQALKAITEFRASLDDDGGTSISAVPTQEKP